MTRLSSTREPLSTTCSNAGFDDRWTSPCCYAEIEEAGSPGTYPCPECGRQVRCTREHQLVCHSELVADGEKDDG